MAASKEGIARARQILENDRREINKVEEHYAGGGCKNCPAKKMCGGTYRGSVCSAMRYKHGVDFDPLTHAEQMTPSWLTSFAWCRLAANRGVTTTAK